MNETTRVELMWDIIWEFDKRLNECFTTICGAESTITEDVDGFISKSPIEVRCSLLKGHGGFYHTNGMSKWLDQDNEVVKYIREQLEEQLKQKFAEFPWWCIICGEGGNYEGERPDLYWYPPEDHFCNLVKTANPALGTRVKLGTISEFIRDRFDVV